CPESPMPAISPGLTFDFLSTAFVAAQVAFHQSCGSCSLHPGLGVEIACSAVAVARTLPSSSQISVFVPLVPMSMPSKCAISAGDYRESSSQAKAGITAEAQRTRRRTFEPQISQITQMKTELNSNLRNLRNLWF